MKRLFILLTMFAAMSAANAQQQDFVVYYNGQRILFDAEKLDSMKFVTQHEDEVGGYKYVDLGLSVMWATHNLGAEKSSDVGEYFGWTQNIPFGDYDSYDEGWRMPTDAEFEELCTLCVWRWMQEGNDRYDGVAGYEIEGTNGNVIFLPATGYYNLSNNFVNPEPTGYYWSSDEKTADNGFNMKFNSLQKSSGVVTLKGMLFPIRPVFCIETEEES